MRAHTRVHSPHARARARFAAFAGIVAAHTEHVTVEAAQWRADAAAAAEALEPGMLALHAELAEAVGAAAAAMGGATAAEEAEAAAACARFRSLHERWLARGAALARAVADETVLSQRATADATAALAAASSTKSTCA